MKFSEQWLREWVNPDLTTTALADQLSMAGLEVDAITPVAGQFSGVVVGEVVACEQHPNADKLSVTRVNTGAAELLDIVCGAPNCRTGLKVAVATVGAVLPGNFKIKKTKLRGEPSHGMLCSAAELQLSEEQDGILELADDAPVGTDVRDYLQLDDYTIDVDLTPNRADCLGLRGLARELGVLNRLDVKTPDLKPVAATHQQEFPVTVSAPDACPRYLGRVIKDIDVSQPTPLWLQEKLRRSGLRPIDAVVDVTNYVLLELGQPLHAFDLAQLEGQIEVRHAKPAEKLTLLDGQEVTLAEDILVIADTAKPLALAGIFGGIESGVTSDTKDVFLESAFFAPATIMGKSRRFGLHTDASHRYERGVDPELQQLAMERATELLIDICGGEPGPITEVVSEEHLPQPQQIRLRASRLSRVLGVEVAPDEVTTILARLGFAVTQLAEEWQVIVPTYRFDLTIEEDLIEEVARVYGYNTIPAEAPLARLSMQRQSESRVSLRGLQEQLLAKGYQEAITYSFVDPKHQTALFPDEQPLALPQPISTEMSSMRLSLWPGLLSAAAYNQKRQQTRIRLFETGLRFIPESAAAVGVRQEPVVAGLLMGDWQAEHWADGHRSVDFYDLKGQVESLLAYTGQLAEARFVPAEHSVLHPGQSAAVYLGEHLLGYLGAVHPQHGKMLGLKGRAFVFELDLALLQQRPIPTAGEVSRYPAIRRDIAVLVDQQVPAGEILECIRKVGVNHIVGLNLFDVYQGEHVPAGQQSLAIAMTLQATDRTLEDSEVNDLVQQVVTALKQQFKAVLRDS